MEVFYNNKLLESGIFLKPSETQLAPKITFNEPKNDNKLYTLIMYDPDAVNGTYVHWLVTNISNREITNGNEVLKYMGPAPPPKTGRHHYIFELYIQTEFTRLSINERSLNSIELLKSKLPLKNQTSTIFFISQNETGGKLCKIIKSKSKTKNKRNKNTIKTKNKNKRKTRKYKHIKQLHLYL
jgi:hypothetical protein